MSVKLFTQKAVAGVMVFLLAVAMMPAVDTQAAYSQSLSIKVGQYATVYPSNVSAITSSNSRVASAERTGSSKGKITGYYPGSATVTAKNSSGTVIATYQVTVSNQTQTTNRSLNVGSAVSISHANASSFSTNSSAVRLSTTSGTSTKVTAVQPGTAVVQIKNSYGGVLGSYTFQVSSANVSQSLKVGSSITVNSLSNVSYLTSSSSSIVSVSGKTMTGMRAGTTKVYARNSSGSTLVIYTVTVSDNTTNFGSKSIKVGNTMQLKTSLAGVYTSSNSSVASVSNSGLVTGLKSGAATITIKTSSGGVLGYYTVNVSNSTTSLGSKTLTVGQSATLSVGGASSYTSSNPSVASVSNAGKVTSLRSGSTTITVKNSYGGVLGYVYITVNDNYASLGSKSLYVGYTLTVGGGSTSYVYSSSNSSVASVSSSGKVSALKAGSAKITLKNSSGGVLGYYSITVQDNTTSMGSKSLKVGQSIQFNQSAYTYSGNNSSVAEVTSSGKITGRRAGTVTVTIKNSSGGVIGTYGITITDNTSIIKTYSMNVGRRMSVSITGASSYTSSNSSVVSASGSQLNAVKAGTAYVTVKNSYGGTMGRLEIVVNS